MIESCEPAVIDQAPVNRFAVGAWQRLETTAAVARGTTYGKACHIIGSLF